MSSETNPPATPETSPEKPEASVNESGNDTVVDLNAKKITDLETAFSEEKKKYLYLYAEFDNFKKRAVKERSDAMKFGWENIAREILGVVDNLERAVEHMPATVDANLKMGIEMTVAQFRTTLEKQGVAIIPTDVAFNPELHEAMGQEPSEKPSGSITKAMVKGYTLHGRLLRPAKVIVSAGPAN